MALFSKIITELYFYGGFFTKVFKVNSRLMILVVCVVNTSPV